MGTVPDKEGYFSKSTDNSKKVKKLDLHGFSLNEANKIVKNFIIKSSNDGYKKILIITGKGLRSKSQENPYISEKLGTLKYSIPDYIENDETVSVLVQKIIKADLKDGGEGSIYIYLKNKKKL